MSVRTLAMMPDELTAVTPNMASALTGPQPSSSATTAPGSAVEQQVEHADRGLQADLGDEVGRGVLQAEQEQQQHDADLRAGLEEPVRRVERHEPADAEREPGQEVQRDGGQAPPAGEPAEHAEPEEDGAELQQQLRGVHPQPSASRRPTAATPSSVPTTMTLSPDSNRNDGAGDGVTSPRRATATTDAPVRVRIWASPSVRPTYGELRPEDDALGRDALDLLAQPGQALGDPRGAEQLGEHRRLLGAQVQDGAARVRVVLVVQDELAVAVHLGHDADALPTPDRQVVPQPDPREPGLLDVHVMPLSPCPLGPCPRGAPVPQHRAPADPSGPPGHCSRAGAGSAGARPV